LEVDDDTPENSKPVTPDDKWGLTM
jgi:hypothetical protein